MLKLDEKVFLRLHKEYILSFKLNVKLFNQRIDSFIIKHRVKRLTYELDLSSTWRIHSIILVTQLKSASSKSNSYNRFSSNHSNVLKIENMFNTDVEKNYEIERLVSKRIRTYNKIVVTQYLVRWLEYESKYDEWKSLSALADCIDLIEKYELVNSAKTIRNKILNVVDARRFDDSVDLKKPADLMQLVKKTTKNKILNAVDARKLVDTVDLKQSVETKKQKMFAVDKSARLKKPSASSFVKRSRDRSLKRLQSKKKRRFHEFRQLKIILSSSNSHYYREEIYIEFVIEFQKK